MSRKKEGVQKTLRAVYKRGIFLRRGTFPNKSGVTLTEVIIAVTILSIAVILTATGARILRQISENKAQSEAYAAAQLELIKITRDIRNAKYIVSAATDTLVLQVYDTRNGFNVNENPGLFDSVNVGTMTYQYTESDGMRYLRKTIVFNGNTFQDKRLLRNFLVKPDSTHYIFNPCPIYATPPCPIGVATPPYESVEVALRINPVFSKGDVKNFTALAMRRSTANLL